MIPALFQGVLGLVVLALLIALVLSWVVFPWVVFSKLERLIKLTSENTAAMNKHSAAIQAALVRPSVDSTPLPPKIAEQPGYYVLTGNDTTGPFPIDKIRELRKRGVIDEGTLIAAAGGTEWKKPAEFGIE